jgi:hypothetical protein
MGVKERPNVAAIDKADYLLKEKGHKQVTPSRQSNGAECQDTLCLRDYFA